MPTAGVHVGYLDAGDRKIILAAGPRAALCPAANGRTGCPPPRDLSYNRLHP